MENTGVQAVGCVGQSTWPDLRVLASSCWADTFCLAFVYATLEGAALDYSRATGE